MRRALSKVAPQFELWPPKPVESDQERVGMRNEGIWHPRLLHLIAQAGHGDAIVVADPGLPIPSHVETIDLVWRRDEPRFLPVVDAICRELAVESALVAAEAHGDLLQGIEGALAGASVTTVPHAELKRRVQTALVVVRTGEATPYSNVVLNCGVGF